MLHLHKNYFFIFSFIFFSIFIKSAEDPYLFIDKNAQKMVQVLTNDSDLFELNRELFYEGNSLFEPMVDFRRVGASVMGKKYYLLASKDQRSEFVLIFRDSLLDTYAETLAQWGDSTITTIYPKSELNLDIKNLEVKQTLNTGNSQYPIG